MAPITACFPITLLELRSIIIWKKIFQLYPLIESIPFLVIILEIYGWLQKTDYVLTILEMTILPDMRLETSLMKKLVKISFHFFKMNKTPIGSLIKRDLEHIIPKQKESPTKM